MKFDRESLSIKQSVMVLIAAIWIGLITAVIQLTIEFGETRQAFLDSTRQVINTAQQVATQAAYSFDEASARKVVDGLFEYTPIFEASIIESFGSVLAQKKRSPQTGELDWLAENLADSVSEFKVMLTLNGKNTLQLVGTMQVKVSSYQLIQQFFARAIRILIFTLVQSVILAVILLILFNLNITQPLLSIVSSLTQVDIEKPTDITLATPKNHEKDELGLLVSSTNQMLTAIKSDADKIAKFAQHTSEINRELEREIIERRTAEAALKEAHNSLETRVEQRTEELTKEIAIRKQIEVDLKEATAAAQKANKSKSTFLANMSHEIRTPLNAILGFSQILGRDKRLPTDVLSTMYTIEKSGTHLLELINDILDLSKIEAGAMELQLQDFDLHELVIGVAEMFSLRCSQLRLHWQLDNQLNNPQPVHGDQRKIRQILLNLVGNAVKFTEYGEVTLSATQTAQNHYLFKVKDSGPGIAKADHKNIFKSFHQTSAGSDKGGTGLGLAICSKFLTMMGSELALDSDLGKGCEFFFNVNLPVADQEIESRDSRQATGLKLKQGASVTALVVDDVAENRILLSFLLEELGVTVLEAENGKIGLEKLSQSKIDIIFLDLRMPVMDGYEAAYQIRKRYHHRPKCIAVSASVLSLNLQSVEEKGFDDFILKPFRIERVYRCLQQHLADQFYVENPPVNNPEPSADRQEPSANKQALSADRSDRQEPSADRSEPSADRSEPSANKQAPSADEQEPSADRSEPSADRSEPSANKQAPSADEQAPSANPAPPAVSPLLSVAISSKLKKKFVEAAKSYQLSQLNDLLEPLIYQGGEQAKLAGHIEQLIKRYDMPQIITLVEKLPLSDEG